MTGIWPAGSWPMLAISASPTCIVGTYCDICIKLQIFSEYFKMAYRYFIVLFKKKLASSICLWNNFSAISKAFALASFARRVSLRKKWDLRISFLPARRLKYQTSNPCLQIHDLAPLAPLAWKTAGKPLSSWPEIQQSKIGSFTSKKLLKNDPNISETRNFHRGLGLPRRSKRSARRSSARSRAMRKVLRIWPKSQSWGLKNPSFFEMKF